MAAPVFGTAGTALAYGSARTSSAVPLPASTAADDVVVVYFLQDQSGSPLVTVSPPAGQGLAEVVFSPLLDTSSPLRLQVWWKRLTGADTGSYTFTHASAGTEAIAMRYTGVQTSGTPIETYPTTGAVVNNTSTNTTPTVSGTTGGPDRLLLYIGGIFQTSAFAPTAGWTERYDGSELTVDEKAQATAGATGSVGTTTTGTASRSAAGLFALLPTATASVTVAQTHPRNPARFRASLW
jgi:hypothetical protein